MSDASQGFGAPVPQLPPQLILHLYGLKQLTLRDRLRGHCVCKAWRQALVEEPIQSLVLGGLNENVKLYKWAIAAQPCVEQLSSYSNNQHGLLSMLLHSLPRQVLRKLVLISNDPILPAVLPCPAIFANLREMQVTLAEDLEDAQQLAAWLADLQGLRRLELLDLDMRCAHAAGPPASEVLALPAIAGLTKLALSSREELRFAVPWAGLPSLRELTLHGTGSIDLTGGGAEGGRPGAGVAVPGLAAAATDGGSTDATAATTGSSSACAWQLSRLTAGVRRLVVDFSAMPVLVDLSLGAREVVGHGVADAAARLTLLELGDVEGHWAPGRWHASLLGMAASLRGLCLCGDWAAHLVAGAPLGLPRLEALSVHSPGEPPLPPEGSGLWASLRALEMVSTTQDSPPVPEALCAASHLEWLQLWSKKPTACDLDVLSSLPRLRHLSLDLDRAVAARTVSVVCKLMPELVTVDDVELVGAEFIEAALAPPSPSAAP